MSFLFSFFTTKSMSQR